MKEIKLYKQPLKSLKLFLLSSLFVIPSLFFIIKKQDHTTILWLSVGFFGIGFVMSLFNMLDRRPRIIINRVGILDRSNRQGLIPWEMIKEAYDINIANQAFISLVMDDKFIVKKKLYKWAKKLNDSAGAQEVNLNVSLLHFNLEKLETLIDILRYEPIEERDSILERYVDRVK